VADTEADSHAVNEALRTRAEALATGETDDDLAVRTGTEVFKWSPAGVALMSDATKIVLGTVGASAFLALAAVGYIVMVGV
jgi:hypothetical protein